jgi:PKD repeat protein
MSRALYYLIVLAFITSSCQRKPSVSFSASPDNAETGEEIRFINQTLYGHSYRWDFGDGSHSYEKEPVKSYIRGGTYNVRLTALSENGKRSDDAVKTLKVRNANKNFIGNYSGMNCGAPDSFEIIEGKNGSEIEVLFSNSKIIAEVSKGQIYIPLQQTSATTRYHGSGYLENTFIIIDLYTITTTSSGELEVYCRITGEKQ